MSVHLVNIVVCRFLFCAVVQSTRFLDVILKCIFCSYEQPVLSNIFLWLHKLNVRDDRILIKHKLLVAPLSRISSARSDSSAGFFVLAGTLVLKSRGKATARCCALGVATPASAGV